MKRLALIAAMTVTSSAAMADAERGKALHDEHCTKCHGSGVYTRDDHFVKDKAGLKKQVQRCHLTVGAQWFEEDVNDVVEYLNSMYYHFE
ncbi:MAG: cytochrome c [Gammaproteobacteria bacterium]|jgi:mono/diheme cytochrome c family protein